MNVAILIGRLGHNPALKLKTTTTGKSVCDFSLATNEKSPKGEETVTWHKITAWNHLAKLAGELKKGQLVMVEGSLRINWEDKAGNKRSTTKVVCRQLTPLNGGETIDKTDQDR